MSQTEELILTTPRFSIARVTHTLPSGLVKSREVIRHNGSVVILPLVEPRQVCLIENHRVAVGRTMIELPAGTLDVGERPEDCAHRELIEETGYRAGRMEPLCSFYVAPGILDEYMHLFVASELTPGKPAREAEEQIENRLVSWDEALRMIHSGQIHDAKTLIGLLLYDAQRTGQPLRNSAP